MTPDDAGRRPVTRATSRRDGRRARWTSTPPVCSPRTSAHRRLRRRGLAAARRRAGRPDRLLRRARRERLRLRPGRSRACGPPGGAATEVFAEVALPDDVDGAGVRPAPGAARRRPARRRPLDRRPMSGAAAVRVGGRLAARRPARPGPGAAHRAPATSRVAVAVADAAGAPVASVEPLALRAGRRGQLTTDAPTRCSGWTGRRPAPATPRSLARDRHRRSRRAGGRCRRGRPGRRASGDGDGAVHARPRGCSALLQDWLADERFAGSRLVVRDRGAVTCAACGGRWGLVRSAQSEHPGRFVLVDTDGTDVRACCRRWARTSRRWRARRRGAGCRGWRVAAPEPGRTLGPGRPGADHRRHRRPGRR